MSAQVVLLPVFVLVGLTFALMFTASGRESFSGGEARDIVPAQLDLPLLFYVLIALALPLRHADLFIVLASWVFVVTCFANAGILLTSNNTSQRSSARLAGALVLLAMWIYFALRILLLI